MHGTINFQVKQTKNTFYFSFGTNFVSCAVALHITLTHTLFFVPLILPNSKHFDSESVGEKKGSSTICQHNTALLLPGPQENSFLSWFIRSVDPVRFSFHIRSKKEEKHNKTLKSQRILDYYHFQPAPPSLNFNYSISLLLERS